MKTEKTVTGKHSRRLGELQEKFRLLEPSIQDANIKQALSLMYGMLQETWRQSNLTQTSTEHQDVSSFPDIANLYRHAPKMEGPAMNRPLSEGTQAPDFELKDAGGNTVRLSDYKGSTVLLVFYPLDWSPGCSQQLDLYQSDMREFDLRNTKLIAISADSIYSHGAWSAVRGIQFPLLADFNPKGDVARKYQVYREADGFSERALYIIDKGGMIRYGYVSPFINHVPDINELFNKLSEVNKAVITV